ncbi:MAG TPA: ABC transporter permease [Nocardioidaceae bacterium]|nr:ABC transporter permease [Nocardioidaceae bacterium]
MTTLATRVLPALPARTMGWKLVQRNYLVYRRGWKVFVTGFLEPVFYLFSIGIGVNQLVDGFTVSGQVVTYTAFVAPAMLAASAMNGAVFDSTYNIFFRLKYAKLYDTVLATPMRPVDIATGEVTWALLRGGVYSAAFLLVMLAMGLVDSWLAVLALPATLLVGFAFAGVGMALTTFMRSWQDFEFVQLAILPMFLFSGTFYPLSVYPAWGQWLIEATPLYRAVLLCRELVTGNVGWGSLVSVVYLAAMGSLGLYVASRRLVTLLLK